MNAFLRKTAIGVYMLMMLVSVVFIPQFTHADDKLPAQNGYKIIVDCTGDKPKNIDNAAPTCTFKDLMNQVDKIISLLLYVATFLAVISFMYAGFRMLTSGGNEDAVTHAKHIFWNVLLGLVFAYAAWIIVHFLITTLGGVSDEGFTLLKKS